MKIYINVLSTIISIHRIVYYDKIIKRECNTRNQNWIYQSNERCSKRNKLNDNCNVMRSAYRLKRHLREHLPNCTHGFLYKVILKSLQYKTCR